MNFAIVEYKNIKKLFDVIPVNWIYHFEKTSFKRKLDTSHKSFYSTNTNAKAPVKINNKINISDHSTRKDGDFYKIIVHRLYGSLFDLILGFFVHSNLKMNTFLGSAEEARMVLKSKRMSATNPKCLSTDADSDEFYNQALKDSQSLKKDPKASSKRKQNFSNTSGGKDAPNFKKKKDLNDKEIIVEKSVTREVDKNREIIASDLGKEKIDKDEGNCQFNEENKNPEEEKIDNEIPAEDGEEIEKIDCEEIYLSDSSNHEDLCNPTKDKKQIDKVN